MYLYACPRDEDDLEIFLINQRNTRLDPEMDERFLERMAVAVEEDRIVVEKLDPVIPSKESICEFIVPADDVLMTYRRMLTEWQAAGWRIDVEAMNATRQRTAYAIPGPARREHEQEWAVTRVPVL